jgi:hypothetical protein
MCKTAKKASGREYSVDTGFISYSDDLRGKQQIYFFFTTVQTDPGAHPAPCIMRLGYGIDHSPPSSAEV